MFKNRFWAMTFFAFFALVFAEAEAQTTPFVTDLRNPVKIISAPRFDGFLVAEAGNATPNSGRVSIVTESGERFTLISGLPSGAAPPDNDSSGPSALWLNRNKLYILIGGGNATLAGPAPGTEIPNPNPNSPLFSSILELRFPAGNFSPERFNYQLTLNQQRRLAEGETVQIGGFRSPRLQLRLLTDFPNYTPAPRPDFPANVRTSNPFGLALKDDTLYIADASQNKIWTADVETGERETFFTYPPKPNPSVPPIPPFIEAVPDNARIFNNSLYVPLLTGFPFVPGFAEIRRINLDNNAESRFIGNLTSAMDILFINENNFCSTVYTLEFSTNLLQGAPGRIQKFTSPDATPTVISNNLISPTSFVPFSDGGFLVTEIFPGRIVRVALP